MRPGRATVLAATTLAVGLTAHTAWNSQHLRHAPRPAPGDPIERTRVAVLVPARNEAHRIEPCLRGLLAQDHPSLEILVLDDGSSDGTGDLVRAAVGDDPRFRVLDGGPSHPPAGWLGKPWACQRLAEAALADGDRPGAQLPGLLVFVDADVALAPDAIRRIVALVNGSGLDLASPYPRQLVGTAAERLVQPLLQWSWLTTLPLRLAEGSPRPSLTAANGQVLAITRTAYRRIGGHAPVRAEVLEDVALARVVKSAGGRAGVTDGTDLATCRMYQGPAELVDGYAKSLWAAFGSPAGALGATGLLTTIYVLPPAAALLPGDRGTRAIGAIGYAAGVLGRVLTARRTGGRPGDAWAHPLSILALDGLTAVSLWRRRRGALAWKGRPVEAA
jgi:GT2 family glycosyltransferase